MASKTTRRRFVGLLGSSVAMAHLDAASITTLPHPRDLLLEEGTEPLLWFQQPAAQWVDAALDRDRKRPHENPSIGVLLCPIKDDEVVEYAMSRHLSPALVAQYETQMIPKAVLQQKTPRVEPTAASSRRW